jgi:hypothetical protein
MSLCDFYKKIGVGEFEYKGGTIVILLEIIINKSGKKFVIFIVTSVILIV